jgi:serine/threonine protein kinase
MEKILEENNLTTIGNYKVIKQIGEGAFGRTYLAEHKILGEKACIKQNSNISPTDEKLLIREAKLLWGIHHYSLPTLHDFLKCPDGSYALVMTYVEGPTLEKIVDKSMEKNKKGVDAEDICWITQRLLNGLHYLHFKGVIHGDVKPANIIVQPEERNAYLVDYGLSLSCPKSTTAPDGYTPAFAPPEQMIGKPPLPESDLYSLGATMIYALGGNPIAKTYPKDTPEQLKKFFDRLVLHNPAQRPHWENTDLIKELSNIREEVFGRRHAGSKSKK